MDTRQATTIARLRKHLDQLPVLPVALLRLMNANASSEGYFEEVERYVKSDPAFATRLLRYANSAASAPPRPIVRVHEALTRLGCTMAVNLILSASAARVFAPGYAWAQQLWIHALGVAALSRHLAPLFGVPRVDPEEAYICGLLHDIGRFILYIEAPDELRQIDEGAWATPQELANAERAACGFTHTELGAIAAGKWGLPTSVADIIRYHHTAAPTGTLPGAARLIQLVRVADWIEHVVAKNGGIRALSEADLKTHLEALKDLHGVTPDDRIAVATRHALEEAERLRVVLDL